MANVRLGQVALICTGLQRLDLERRYNAGQAILDSLQESKRMIEYKLSDNK